ncbi:MAG: hypothetical protein GY835_14170 [bacterium]|nr:hypothetical protein [bacterium]
MGHLAHVSTCVIPPIARKHKGVVMTENFNEASKWRIELARELTAYYSSHDQVRMVVLGGSPVKGLADSASDLDVVVYWEKIDEEWLKEPRLAPTGGERRLMSMMPIGVGIEHYYFGNLKVDFAHLTLAAWEEWVDDVQVKLQPESFKLKTIGGFLDSLPLYNGELVMEWKSRCALFPEELARKVVEGNFRFFVDGCLERQGLDRNDIVFYYDGLCIGIKGIMMILTGLNRIYNSYDEPRWIAQNLERMAIRPTDMWPRIQAMFNGDRLEAIEILDELTIETLNLVAEHMPGIDVAGRLERRKMLGVHPCENKPKLKM